VINLTVVRPNGTPVPLAGGSLVMTIKQRPQDTPAKASIPGVLAPAVGPNAASFTLPSSASKTWQAGRYLYDVVFTDGSGIRDAVIPLSALLMEASVTPPV